MLDHLRALLEREKLNSANFLNWDRNLKIVLTHERNEYVVDQPLPVVPAPIVTRAVRDEYKKHINDSINVACMETDL